MKYEVLEKESQNFLKNLRTEMQVEKSKIEKFEKQLESMSEMYKNQFVNVAGVGCYAFIFQVLLHHQNKEAIEKYCTLKKMDTEATEFLKLQKERMDIIATAQKHGLQVKFNPVEDIENFLNEANKFSNSNIGGFLRKMELDKLADKYQELSEKTSSFLKERKETLFEKKEVKDNARHQ